VENSNRIHSVKMYNFNNMKLKLLFILIALFLFGSCNQIETFDLIIHDSKLLNVKTGDLLKGISIGVKDGVFKKISKDRIVGESKEYVDANGRLVTPTFIDTHIHPVSEFSDGNYDIVSDTIPVDSIDFYRQNLTDGYLPFGTTTVLMMGHPDTWTDEFLKWTEHPTNGHVDVYTCGGALATMDENTYKGHYRLENPEAATNKVTEYYKKGIRHLKLYWRLKEPELEAIQKVADSLNMIMYSHAGGFFDPTQLTVHQLLDRGIRNFEHISILPCSVFDNLDWENIHSEYQKYFGKLEGEGKHLSLLYILETFRYAEENRKLEMVNLIDTLSNVNATISTTIGWIYKTYHDTFFGSAKVSTLSEEQFQRCEENFAILMSYVKAIHKKDIAIRIGSDTAPGGQIVLLEMMLLNQFGISIRDSFKIATINGAEALGIDDLVGSVELNKQANFIIWDESPIENRINLIKGMNIYKDGIKYN